MPSRPRHIGIVGVSAEGAALCPRTICGEAPSLLGPYAHPEVTLHTWQLAEYMRHIEAGRWDAVGEMLLSSARTLVDAGAELLVCPDNTVHQLSTPRSPACRCPGCTLRTKWRLPRRAAD